MNDMALMSSDRESGAASVRAGTGDGRRDDAHRYLAFLSYSHADSTDADWLHQAIERFAVPRPLVGRSTALGVVPRRLTPIFRDRSELAASSDLGQTIRAALRQSRFLIVLCSPAAAASRWVNEEILAFKRLHGERRILAAIVGGEPWASEMNGRAGEECFPPALREKFDRKGQATGKRAEPIAADLRDGRDGREAGKLKLVAGMLGLGLDDLVRRDQQRRHKRLTYLTAASLAGMAVTSGLAIFAFDKRDEARDQRREAEGLVGFMLGDLRDELEPIGKLSALDAVGNRALAYYQHQDKKDLPDNALAQRSHALNLLGQIATARLDWNGALSRYREAMRSTAELVARSPNDPQRLFDHAQNVFYVGDIARKQGDVRGAEGAYREYQRLANQMVAIDPDNSKWRMEVLYANENLGIILLNQRRFPEAIEQFRESLKPLRTGGGMSARTADVQAEVSTLLAWLADSNAAAGRLSVAAAVRRQEIAFLRGLLAKGSTNVAFREHLIPAYQGLGNALVLQGRVEEGVRELRSGVAEADQLLPTEPDNAVWLGYSAQGRLLLAAALLDEGHTTDAERQIDVGCAQSERVLNRDSTAAWRSLRTSCLSARGRLAMAQGAPLEAIGLLRHALASARTEHDADLFRGKYTVASVNRLIGDAFHKSGNEGLARASWEDGMRALPVTSAERPREVIERIVLLERTGRAADAHRLDDYLNRRGIKYRVGSLPQQQGGTHGA